jgi:TetR/AcrR family transcriptional repressor of nem operon
MPRVKLFNEKEVLNKAINLFWKQGYAATSVQDLVNHLGINRASLYNTFGDKEKLFKKAFEEYRKNNTEGIKQFFKNHSNIKVGLKNLFQIAIDEAINDKDRKGCFVVNTTTELIPNDSKTLHVLKENQSNFEKIFYDYLSLGVEKGQISRDKDLKIISTLLYTFYNGLRVVTKVDSSKTKLHKSINVLLSVLD